MRFSIATLAILVMIFAAACSGDSGEARVLPTSMALPTLENTDVPTEEARVEQQPTEEPIVEPTSTPEPTEEPTPETEEPTPVVESPEATEETIGSSLPFAQPQTVGNTEEILPPFARAASPTVDLWTVSADQPVSAFACADTTCEVITTFDPGEELEVIKTGEEWVTAVFEGQEVYVNITLLEPTGPLTAGNQLPPGVSGQSPSSPFGGSGSTDSGNLPPFAQSGSSGGGAPPFAQNTGGSPSTPGGPTPIAIPPAGS